MIIQQLFSNYHISYINIAIPSGYEFVSLLLFLSEKHICILFLIKHFVSLEWINIKWYYMKQEYSYMEL